MFDKQLVCVTGLPRSGSTLLCQLLAHHPSLYCPGHTSPLLQMLLNLRQNAADNVILLAQLDQDPDGVHAQLLNSYKGLLAGWFEHNEEPAVVDKNRGWVAQMDLAAQLDSGCKMLVCVRDLGQIFGSIEAQHQKTLAMDFADHLADHTPFDRANRLFNKTGLVGLALNHFNHAQDLPQDLQQRLLIVVYEELIANPQAVLDRIWPFIGMQSIDIDFSNLNLLPPETDSHYRMKFRHTTYPKLRATKPHAIPKRIEQELLTSYEWFYRIFYPEKLKGRD